VKQFARVGNGQAGGSRAAIHIKGVGLEHFQPKRSRFGVGQCGKTKI
jgi:hypothetical protein